MNELVPDLVPIEHGDVVVFTDPANWLPRRPPASFSSANVVDAALTAVGLGTGDSNDHLIKRVIGHPGDTVVCCTAQGQLTIDDVPLHEPYLQLPPSQSLATRSPFTVTVPKGRLW